MKLADLFLNRFLYRDNQQLYPTQDSTFVAADSTTPPAPALASGGAAQDINTGNVQIDGNQLIPGTVPQTTLDVSNWGWTQTCIFTSASATQVNWGSGSFISAGGITYSISAGNTGTMAAKTYIYLDLNVSATAYQVTTTSSDSVGIGKVLVAVAQNAASSATYNLNEASQIVGDNILANTINASKIVSGSITATQIASGTITATQIASGTITTTQLNFTPVQSTNVIASINASSEGITISGSKITINGTTTFSSGYDPTTKLPTASAGSLAYLNTVGNSQIDNGAVGATKVDTTIISGGKIITGLLTASNITTGTLDASVVTVSNLNANNITSGAIQIGGTSKPSTITIIESSAGSAGSTTSLLNWKSTGGTLRGKIWADSSGYMGYNAIGGYHYFYTNSNENVVIIDGAQTVFNYGAKIKGSFNVGDVGGTTYNSRFNGGYVYFANTGTAESIYGGNANRIEYNATTYHYHNIGGNLRLRLSNTGLTLYNGYLYQPDSDTIYLGPTYSFRLTSNKTAIVPTSEGFNALYCTESPEVWFMDFCGPDKILDPMFEEVSTGPYRYIKCEDGGYQVWGKRKGHERYRFEKKTEAEFIANERFLKMNRPENQIDKLKN